MNPKEIIEALYRDRINMEIHFDGEENTDPSLRAMFNLSSWKDSNNALGRTVDAIIKYRGIMSQIYVDVDDSFEDTVYMAKANILMGERPENTSLPTMGTISDIISMLVEKNISMEIVTRDHKMVGVTAVFHMETIQEDIVETLNKIQDISRLARSWKVYNKDDGGFWHKILIELSVLLPSTSPEAPTARATMST